MQPAHVTTALPGPRAPIPPAPAEDLLSIMIACLKGGTGKSRSAWMILCELARRGYRPLGVDGDPVSQTLHDSYRQAVARGYDVPFTVISWPSAAGFGPGIRAAVASHNANALVVDVGGGEPEIFDQAVWLCDELIVPCAPNKDETRRLPATFERAMTVVGGGLTSINPSVLLVKTSATSRDAAEARVELAEMELANGHRGLPVMEAHVPYSVLYPRLFGHVTEETGAYRDVVEELLAVRAEEGLAA